jgi:hypothetical protein
MKNTEYLSACCSAPFHEPDWPDNDMCSECGEHTEPEEDEEDDVEK